MRYDFLPNLGKNSCSLKISPDGPDDTAVRKSLERMSKVEKKSQWRRDDSRINHEKKKKEEEQNQQACL